MIFDTERERVRFQNILLSAPTSQKSIPSVARRLNADICRSEGYDQSQINGSTVASQMVQQSAADGRDKQIRR